MDNNRKCENIKEEILRSSAEMFYTYGYNRASIRQISSQLGISLSRINYHFESKANLASIICRDFLERFRASVFGAASISAISSPLTELCAIHLLFRLVFTNRSCRRFFRDIASTDILFLSFIEVSMKMYDGAQTFLHTQFTEAELSSYATMYAHSISGFLGSLSDNMENIKKSADYYGEMYERLFLKLIDFPRAAQNETVSAISAMLDGMSVEMTGFDEEIKIIKKSVK